jgi:hypothetical protein
MIQNTPIYDIYTTEDFIADYDSAPARIKRRIDRILYMILQISRLPNSIQAHQSFTDELWIGYVTTSRQAWRMLFWHNSEEDTITLHRLVTHDEMDNYFGKKIRS